MPENSLLLLVPDRSNLQVAFLDSESRLCLDELYAGNGYYDGLVEFADSGDGRLSVGDIVVIEITGGTITAGSFDSTSITANGSEGFTVAAHIGSIGSDDNDSGWIGGDPGEPIPEPATILQALLGGGAAAGARRRRMKLKAESQK